MFLIFYLYVFVRLYMHVQRPKEDAGASGAKDRQL